MNRKQRRIFLKHERIEGARTTKHRLLPLVLALGVMALFSALGLYVYLSTEAIPSIRYADQQVVARGRNIYARDCASCHGTNLQGQPNWKVRLANGKLPAPPHDASGHTWHHSDKVLFDITRRGSAAYSNGYATDMPAFGSRLSDEDIAAVLAFIKSTWSDDILQRQLRTNAQVR
jgi:S-disulfanyl-L-cysteine oxidoreductase SoxD